VELDGIRTKASDPLRGGGEGGMEFAGKMVSVDVQLGTQGKIGVGYSFVLVTFDMGDFWGGEKEKSIGD